MNCTDCIYYDEHDERDVGLDFIPYCKKSVWDFADYCIEGGEDILNLFKICEYRKIIEIEYYGECPFK